MKIGEPRKFTVVFIRKKSFLLATIRKILILSMLLFCVTLSYILENIRRLLWFDKKMYAQQSIFHEHKDILTLINRINLPSFKCEPFNFYFHRKSTFLQNGSKNITFM